MITDDVTLNDQFLLAEDLALKKLLQGVTVTDGAQNPRPVGVWYSMPDPELQKQNYPYFTLDLIDVIENRPQVMSSYGYIEDDSYLVNGIPAYDTDDYGIGHIYGLTPMLLTYQVTSWARSPRHDRSIVAQTMFNRLHPRFAEINVNNNWRRLIVLSFSKRDTTSEAKRLFRNVWTIQVPSELFYTELTLTQRAAAVMINSGSLIAPPDGMSQPVLYPGIS